jgi:hypothetical protein
MCGLRVIAAGAEISHIAVTRALLPGVFAMGSGLMTLFVGLDSAVSIDIERLN